MPIDFCNGEWYTFDFNKLLNDFKKNSNSNQFNKYLDDWKILLVELDNKSAIEYNYYAEKYISCEIKPEFYQFRQKYMNNKNPYIFHFNIDNILKNIMNSKYKKYLANVKKIASIVSYDNSIIIDSRKIKREPIVLCELPMPKYRYMVIDGNTRLNYFLNNNKWLIKYIIYNIQYKSDFLLSIDWATYNFVMEIEKIINIKNSDKLGKIIANSKIYNPFFLKETNN